MGRSDAGGGARGERASFRPDLGLLLQQRYGLVVPGPVVDVGGSSNLNLLAVDGRGRVVVRVYRRYVTAGRLGALRLLRDRAAHYGIPVPPLVSASDGDPFVVWDGRLVEVERFIACDAWLDCWPRLLAGLPWLGRLHAALAAAATGSIAEPGYANAVDSSDLVVWTRRGTDRIRGWEPAHAAFADEADALAEAIDRVEAPLRTAMYRQPVHGDFWDNNVGFRDGELAMVTDFDFAGTRPRVDDLALTLYFAQPALPHSRRTPESLRTLVDAYNSGLAEPLSGTERAALPAALARQALWGVARWVAELDDEPTARVLVAELTHDIAWARRIMAALDRWQQAFQVAEPKSEARQ
jgi:homoserine kinase type II